MKSLEKFKDNNFLAYNILKNSYMSDKIAHSYLFYSNDKNDLEEFIFNWIKVLIYKDQSNDDNLSIFSYPDFYTLDSSDPDFSKTKLISILENLSFSSLVENKPKILYIKNLDTFKSIYLNTLLKTLEEPKKNVYIILGATKLNKVLKTIYSRTVNIKINSFKNKDQLKNSLKAIYPECNYLNVLVKLSENEKEAIFYMENLNFKKVYQQMLESLEKFLKNIHQGFTSLNKIIDINNYELVGKIMILFFKDVFNYSQKEAIVNQDFEHLIQQYQTLNLDIFKVWKIVDQFLKRAKINLNFELVKNSFLIKISELYE